MLNALTSGSIDVYAEYTGTIAREILKLDAVPSLAELNTRLAAMGLAAAVPLGFNDTYALAIRGDDATREGHRHAVRSRAPSRDAARASRRSSSDAPTAGRA